MNHQEMLHELKSVQNRHKITNNPKIQLNNYFV